MATTAPPQTEPSRPALLAPWWHTIVLLLILLGVSASQAHSLGHVVDQHGKVALYLSTMFMEWVLVGFIWLGTRRRIAMRELIGGRWSSPEDFLLDVAIAAGYWLASLLILAGVRLALGQISIHAAENQKKMGEMTRSLGFLAPNTSTDVVFFILLTLTAGFCEEVIFRGYLQKQFQRASGSVAAGVVVQALAFGAAHGYQGWKLMVTIGVYGAMFGILAAWRKSLRPGMIAHAWQDLASGLILRALIQHPIQ